jgi:hypothetical protein
MGAGWYALRMLAGEQGSLVEMSFHDSHYIAETGKDINDMIETKETPTVSEPDRTLGQDRQNSVAGKDSQDRTAMVGHTVFLRVLTCSFAGQISRK